MVLPPCHYGFQVYTRELSFNERLDIAGKNNGYEYPNRINVTKEDNKFWDEWLIEQKVPTRAISLMWNQRSVDTFLGLPFNIASYGLLLEIIAKEVNMVPDELIGNLGDTHLYSNHIEQAKEQITREPYSLPTITLPSSLQPNNGNWDKLVFEDFYLNDYQSHPTIKAPLSN
jgi:thymidylate synthase